MQSWTNDIQKRVRTSSNLRQGSHPLPEDVSPASQGHQPEVVRGSFYHWSLGMTTGSCEKGCAKFYVALSF